MLGPCYGRKLPLQGRDHPLGIVNRQRRLGCIGQFIRISDFQGSDVLGRFDQVYAVVSRRVLIPLAQCAFYFGVACMPNQHHVMPGLAVPGYFQMNLGDQRTGRIKDLQAALCTRLTYIL